MHNLLLRTFKFGLSGSIIVLGLLTVAGFASDLHWRFGWYSQPRVHILTAQLFITTLSFYLFPRTGWLWIALVPIGINLYLISPFFIPTQLPERVGYSLEILHLNTDRGEADLSFLENTSADVVFLQEVTPELAQALSTRFSPLDISHLEPNEFTNGSAILTSPEIQNVILKADSIRLPAESGRSMGVISLAHQGGPINLLNATTVRAFPPRYQQTDRFQALEFRSMGEWSTAQQREDHHVVVIGDFNATPWSQRSRRLLRDGKLKDSMWGYGLQNSWPTMLPAIFGIPIDHAVVSQDLYVIRREVFDVEGTDHRALSITIGLEIKPDRPTTTIDPFGERFRIVASQPMSNTHGSLVLIDQRLSPLFSGAEVHFLPGYSSRPMVSVGLDTGQGSLSMLSVHTTRPQNPNADTFQALEFEAVAGWSQARVNRDE